MKGSRWPPAARSSPSRSGSPRWRIAQRCSSSACATTRPSYDEAARRNCDAPTLQLLSGGRRGVRGPAWRRSDAGAAAAHRRAGELRRRRRPRYGRRGGREPLFDRRSSDHRLHRHPAAASEHLCGACARPCARWWRRGRMCSSSSTVRASPCGIARRVRAADPSIPIVEYVSPSVWAWRPGRARAMRRYIDHILALLPFEPEVHRTARRSALHLCRTSAGRARSRAAAERGRRRSGGRRPSGAAGAAGKQERRAATAAGRFLPMPWRGSARRIGPIEVVLPTAAASAWSRSEQRPRWPVRPRIVVESRREARRVPHRAGRRWRSPAR